MNTIERTESRPIQDLSENTNNNNYSEILELIHESEQTTLYNVKNTGLGIIRTQNEYCVLIGNKRLNKLPFNTIEDAIKDAERTDLPRIIQLIGAISEITTEIIQK